MVSRLKLQYCKIVLATSLVWFLLDVVLLMYYTDCATNAATDCNGGHKGKETKAESGSLLKRILPKEPVAPVKTHKEQPDKLEFPSRHKIPPKLPAFKDSVKPDEQLEQDLEYCSIVDSDPFRNPCIKDGNFDELELKKLRDSFNELKDNVTKQIKENDEQVKRRLETFEGKVGNSVKQAETEVIKNLESLASNVETRIQLREQEIDGRIKLSIREVEGSLKVFEREVETYMKNIIKNIDDNLLNREKVSMDKLGQYVGAVEDNLQKMIINVHSNVEVMLNEVKNSFKLTCNQAVLPLDKDGVDKKNNEVEVKTSLQGHEESQTSQRFRNTQEEIYQKQMEMASIISVEERDRQNMKDIDQRQADDSIWLAVACQRGEGCQKPDWVGDELAYMFELDYYLAKDPGKRNSGMKFWVLHHSY